MAEYTFHKASNSWELLLKYRAENPNTKVRVSAMNLSGQARLGVRWTDHSDPTNQVEVDHPQGDAGKILTISVSEGDVEIDGVAGQQYVIWVD